MLCTGDAFPKLMVFIFDRGQANGALEGSLLVLSSFSVDDDNNRRYLAQRNDTEAFLRAFSNAVN